MEDTICAISTPIGVGGISIIRLSGKDSLRIADMVFKNHSNLNNCVCVVFFFLH